VGRNRSGIEKEGEERVYFNRQMLTECYQKVQCIKCTGVVHGYLDAVKRVAGCMVYRDRSSVRSWIRDLPSMELKGLEIRLSEQESAWNTRFGMDRIPVKQWGHAGRGHDVQETGI
jgi:hypothetical protein